MAGRPFPTSGAMIGCRANKDGRLPGVSLRAEAPKAAAEVALAQSDIAFANLVTGHCGIGIFLDVSPDLIRYGLCVLLFFTGGLIPAAVLSSSASLARMPKQIGTLQGLFNQVGNIGPFFGPPLIATLVADSGLWRDALIVTGCAAVVGVILGVMIKRLERRTALPKIFDFLKGWKSALCGVPHWPIMLSVRLCRGSSGLFGENQAGRGFPAV